MELKELVIEFKGIRESRLSLESQAKSLKQEEDRLKDEILQNMQETGVASVKFPEVGHVITTEKGHYEVRDKDKFAEAIMRSMVLAYKQNRSLVDGLIVQTRPSVEGLEVFLKETEQTPDAIGLVFVTKTELSIRKS